MPFKVTFFFKQQSSRLAGWSENYWSADTDWSAAETHANALRPLLDKMHGAQAYCTNVRFTQLDPGTGIPLFRYTDNKIIVGSAPRATADDGDADYPTTALLVELKNVDQRKTRQWIRGIDDDQISVGGQFVIKKDFQNRINTFMAQLKEATNNWRMRVLKAANQNKDVTKLDVATGEVTIPQHGFGADGSTIRVRIKGFTTPADVNKIWRAVVKDVNTITLSFAGALVGQPVTAQQPKARLQTYELINITEGKIVRSSSHYTGRPTDTLGGKRRKRKK